MSENNFTTMRVSRTKLAHLREYKPSPSTSDDDALGWVLDKLTEADKEINGLHDEIEKLKKEGLIWQKKKR